MILCHIVVISCMDTSAVSIQHPMLLLITSLTSVISLEGLSLIQGGPTVVLRSWVGAGEKFDQLQEGLERSGLAKVRFLFLAIASTIPNCTCCWH